MAATMATGYTVTFSNMAVKANDSMVDLAGRNMMADAMGQENYQQIKDVSAAGSNMIFMLGLSNPRLYGTNNNNTENIRENAKIGNGDEQYSVGDATFMDSDDAFARNISHRTDVDANGYYDVVAHGTPNGIQITHNGQHMIVDHRTAARLIQNSDGYNGQAIRLLSCNTGSLDNGFAQNLANTLNVEVSAPTNYLWSAPSGNYFVAGMNNSGLPNMNDMGNFKLFMPGGN